MKRLLCLAMAFSWACDDGDATVDPQAADAMTDAMVDAMLPDAEALPECATHAIYAPAEGVEGAFPDDAWTVADSERSTGLRVDINASNAPWIADISAGYQPVFEALNDLDGWGTNAEIFLRFDAALTPFEGMHDSVKLLDLSGDSPVELRYTAKWYDEGTRLGITPLLPLASGTPHAVLVTDDVPVEAEGCVQSSAGLRALLDGTESTPRLQPLIPRYADLVAAVDADVSTWVHAALFTTQSVFESSQAIAADIAGRTYRWDDDSVCSQRVGRQVCTRSFLAGDYRVDGVIQPPPTRTVYRIPVQIVIPDGEGPFPVMFCGHGLSGSKSFCQNVSGYSTAPVVIVGIDAPHHGDHPAGSPDNAAQLLQAFFAADLLQQRIDAPRLRDNFRTATFDRLQLLKLIHDAPDLDSNGTIDADTTRMGYFGISLGGIMASEFLALADGITAAKLNVSGARLNQIIRDASSFAPLVTVLSPRGQTDGGVSRIFAAVQTVLEAGEPNNWARHVTADRFLGEPPHVLLTMAMDDSVVPNSATLNLARALGVAVVPPMLTTWTDIDLAEGAVSGNLASGVTGGLVQFAEVDPGGGLEPADHNNTVFSAEVRALSIAFFDAWQEGEMPSVSPAD